MKHKMPKYLISRQVDIYNLGKQNKNANSFKLTALACGAGCRVGWGGPTAQLEVSEAAAPFPVLSVMAQVPEIPRFVGF